MTHEFLPVAQDEFVETVDFYETQRRGLGVAFRDAVRHALANVTTFSAIGRPGPRGTRRALIAGFPYDLVYLALDERIVIVALAHHRRRPGYWKDRVRP